MDLWLVERRRHGPQAAHHARGQRDRSRSGRPTARRSTSSPRARARTRCGGCPRGRRGHPGDEAAARRRRVQALARRADACVRRRGVRRLRHARVHRQAHRRAATRRRAPRRSTTASCSATGTPGRTGRRAHLFAQKLAGGPRGEPAEEAERRLPDQALRRRRGLHREPRRQDGRLRRARRGPRRGVEHRPQSLLRAARRQQGAHQAHREQPRHRHAARVFSPDGKTLAYLAMSRPEVRGRQAARDGARRRHRQGALAHRRVGPVRGSSLAWSKDGKTLFVTADNLGQHGVFSSTSPAAR